MIRRRDKNLAKGLQDIKLNLEGRKRRFCTYTQI
jgi:hypothetical protein